MYDGRLCVGGTHTQAVAWIPVYSVCKRQTVASDRARLQSFRSAGESNQTMSLISAAIVVIAAAVLSLHVDACSMPVGWRPQSAVEKVLHAQEVLFATVRRTFPDHKLNYGGDGTTVYTAEVAVHCILKGHRSDGIVNITMAGE